MSSTPTITFETNTLSSAISKAARVAPNKGPSYDRAAGILVEINPEADKPAVVKATDLEVTYLEGISTLKCESDPLKFRVPSAVFTGILSGLPLGSETKLEITDSHVVISCGRKKAKVVRFDAGAAFPLWEAFDPNGLSTVNNFSALTAQVSWACSSESIPFTGVRMDGTHLWASDKYRVARVPCQMEIDDPITAPLNVLRPILKNLSDARVGARDSKLLLMPDEFTQITSVIFPENWPDIQKNVVDKLQHNASLVVDRERFRDAVNAMMVLCKTDRYPRVRLTIGGSRIHIHMDVPDVGEMSDEIEVNGAEHDDVTIHFTPTYLTNALDATQSSEVVFAYDTNNTLSLGHISDETDYNAWFTSRRETDK